MSGLIARPAPAGDPIGPDAGDEESPRLLEPVRVTADFREGSRAELPSSLTVIDQTTIEDAGMVHFVSLANLVPNLNYAMGTSRPRYFQIRGIGELEQYEGAPNPSVGFLIDDIDFSGVGGVATLFDTEQVEVLRGPQGTRYGANALAGLINMRTVDPTPHFTLKAELMAGDDDARGGGLAFGGPIADTLAYRLVAASHENDGYRDNQYVNSDHSNGRDEKTLRGKLRFEPSPDLRVDLTGMHVDLDNGYDAWAIDNSRTTLSDKPGEDDQTTKAGAVRVSWAPRVSFELVSITTAADNDATFSFDGDWGNDESWGEFGPYDFFSETDRERKTFSQDLRLVSGPGGEILGGSTDWLIGGYFLHVDETNDILDLFNGAVFRELDSDYDASSAAVYGQVDSRLSPRLTLSIGLRLERRWADYHDTNGVDFDPSDTMPGGNVSLSFDYSDHAMFYAAVSRGYKAGGFNIGTLIPDDRREYDPEYLWNYELGMKATWPERGLFTSLALFYSDRDDAQVSTSFQIDPADPLSFIFLTDNAAEGHNYGAEAELQWAFHRDWGLEASLGLLQTEYDDYAAPNRDLDGRSQAFAPEYVFNLGLVYRDTRGFFGRVDLAGKDGFYYSDSHDQKADAHRLVNARVGYEADAWSVYLWGRNVFDENYTVHGFYFANEPPDWNEELYEQPGDGSQFGLQVNYRY